MVGSAAAADAARGAERTEGAEGCAPSGGFCRTASCGGVSGGAIGAVTHGSSHVGINFWFTPGPRI